MRTGPARLPSAHSAYSAIQQDSACGAQSARSAKPQDGTTDHTESTDLCLLAGPRRRGSVFSVWSVVKRPGSLLSRGGAEVWLSPPALAFRRFAHVAAGGVREELGTVHPGSAARPTGQPWSTIREIITARPAGVSRAFLRTFTWGAPRKWECRNPSFVQTDPQVNTLKNVRSFDT